MRVPLALCWLLCACAPTELGAGHQAIIGGVRDSGDPQVVLLVSYPPDESMYATCTAAVIAPRVLVTAAHCVDTPNHPGHTYGVFVGDDASPYATTAQLKPSLLPVDAVHAHPDYDPAPPFVADIGVVVTSQPLPVSALPIARAPLPPSLPGQPARLVGYGQTQYQIFNAQKYTATTTVAALPADDTVVVGDATRHSCLGDSGGPALVMLDGTETIIGVDSYTESSGCKVPAHYRRTDRYLPFLDAYAPPSVVDLGHDDLAPPDAAMATGGDAGETTPVEGLGCSLAGRSQASFGIGLWSLLACWWLRRATSR